ncbi:MAG: PEGA domain-containing protein [Gammaproteobacteria bacterium]|nr:PEGA domain-containing protein [Gammaproteobacteria bacterium]
MSRSEPNVAIRPAAFHAGELIQPAQFHPVRGRRTGRRFRLRPGRVLVGAVLLLCAAAAWFVLTARSLYVETEPAGAEIIIATPFQVRFADHFLIRSGSHEIEVAAEGYHPVHETLRVGEEQNQHVAYALTKLPGHVRVETGSISGARVVIDSEERGQTPLTVRELPPGEHALAVTLDRYLPYQGSVAVEGRDIEQKLELELTPAWGDITLSSRPAGAEVYVNEERVGRTPLVTPVLQGRHELRVQLSGYKAWQQGITVTANEPQALPEIALEPADAVVLLDTVPSRANVIVNGAFRGQTPLEVSLTPGEPATIRVFKEGHVRASEKIVLQSGEKKSLRIVLQPELAPIEFTSEPPGAELFIDGAARGQTGRTVELPARPHNVRISKAGYVDYETTVTPRPGIAQQIRVQLKTQEQARLESIKPILKSAAGQTFKLFRPDARFTMGASRREPGRRANEVLREVQLTRPFYLALHETTNQEFKAFASTHSSGAAQNHTLDEPRQPVARITWEQAVLYCNWLSGKDALPPFYQVSNGKVTGFHRAATGYRLPTEAEWEWVARVEADGSLLKFPWGGELPPATRSGNYADASAAALIAVVQKDYKDGHAASAPVGSFPPNARGLYDLGGNAAEWVHDFYDIATDPTGVPRADPLGPLSGEYHVIRGASWAHGGLTELRLSFRDYGIEARDDVGFRIARYLDAQ